MSKIITYNDYIQINPDNRILSLEKSDKVKIIDNMLNSAYSGGKGLVITYDLSHSGRRINNRIYSTKGQQKGIDSLTNPYPKPILKNHNQSSEPIGRFIGGEWQNLYDEATQFLQSNQAALDIHSAFAGDDPEKIYDTLKSFNLIDNKQWPGLGRMRVQANITDEDAIKKFMDGRYLTFSAGSTTDRHVCSICKTDWAQDGMCEHRHGQKYDGEICVFITGDFIVLEGSVVNTPADDLSQLVHMEMRDSKEESPVIDSNIKIEEIILSDSLYNLGETNEAQRIQATEQINTKEEEKEEEDNQEEVVEDSKDFDHMLIIPQEKMQQLHSKGQADVVAVSGKERMRIRLIYRTKENTPGGEDSFFHESSEEFLEELFSDEKMFKVPAGAKGNAQKVLEWKSKHGSEVKGMTSVGWARARQLASKAEIGLSTVKRMAAFNRHRKNAVVAPEFKSTPWKDRGYVAWLGWGGTTGVDWAIRTSAANDSDNQEIQEDAYRSSPKGKGAKTPAKPSERIKGSKKNKKGSASKANSKIEVGSVLETLKEKLSSHNEKHGKTKGKRVTLGMLKAVYRRGAGAFSSTHRPGMSRSGWGVARVNAFLKLVRSGRPSNPKYVQDNDLLPAGHPRKSSNKSKTKKDFNMSEVINEELESLEIESQDSDEDLEVEIVEPTQEEQEEHDASFSEEDDEETIDPPEVSDAEEIDWEFLDLAMQGVLLQEDAQLTTEQRNSLAEDVFCGPDRSFPIPDCAHVTAAKRLIGRYKGPQSSKDKIMACVNRKAKALSCDKSKDYMDLESKYKELLEKYSSLEDKLTTVVESLIVKSKKIEDSDEKVSKTVENEVQEQVLVNDVKIENPSEHIADSEVEQKMTKKPVSNLGSFEQKVVDTYNMLKKDHGEIAAENYLASKNSYLPRGFHPNNI